MPTRTASRGGVTAGQYGFARVPSVGGQRSVFNRSFNLKTAFDGGWIVPIYVDEALPGDTLNMKMSSFCRLATPIFPVMDNIYMDFFFFSVPNRLVWDNWQKFCGEQDDPGDSIDFTIPQISSTPSVGGLSDYMGLPTAGAIAVSHNMLHFRAYNLIYNEWFRDQNLQDSLVVDHGDSSSGMSNYIIRRRGKRHDYFTSALPFPQKGTAVDLPLGNEAPVVSELGATIPGTGIPLFEGTAWTGGPRSLQGEASGDGADWSGPPASATDALWDDPQLIVDLSSATGATINSLREAFQIQRIFERDARAGTRYTEIIKSHFQVSSEDSRLQRPEYLGGGTTKVNISPVAVTADETGRNIGDLAGFGTQSASGIGFVKSFTEHCLLLGFVNVRADISYQEGLERMWSRQTRFDFYWPSLAHLGEQEILNKELVHTAVAADNNAVFGYQERWAEYRYKPSLTTGIMRSAAANSLDAWHLALDFAGAQPDLNATFIEDNPPIARVVAVPSEPEFIGDFWFNYKCARPMPTFSVPGMIDHF